jgi:hypothetical protein
MDKLKLRGRNLGRVILVQGMISIHLVKQLNLKLKTWAKQLLGSLPLAFEHPDQVYYC